MREVSFDNGHVLKIGEAPFAVSLELFEAFAAEVLKIPVMNGTLGETAKNFICASFSSPLVKSALTKCMTRCTYNGGKGDLKIDHSTFEDVSARENYVKVCSEVTGDNIRPFMKDLSALFDRFLDIVPKNPA